MRIYMLLLSLLYFNTLMCQSPSPIYLQEVKIADSLFKNKEFKLAIKYYQNAIFQNNGLAKSIHRYKLAASYVQLNFIDSAFVQLNIMANKGKFKELEIISNEFYLTPIHSDIRWFEFIEIVKKNKIEFEKNGK